MTNRSSSRAPLGATDSSVAEFFSSAENRSQYSYHKPGLLQVLPALSSGGVERGTIEIAKAAVENGFRSYVASAGGGMVQQLYAHGSKHITLPLDSKNPFTLYANYQALCDIIKDYNISIVHARSRAPAWSSFFAAAKSNARFITTFHGTYNFRSSLKQYYNSVMVRGEHVIAISDYIKEHIFTHYRADPERLTVVHRGVDIHNFNPEAVSKERINHLKQKLGIPSHHKVIVLPGRITRWKGQMVVLEALTQLRDLPLTCILAGDHSKHPHFRTELEQFITQHELSGMVKITGPIQDMPSLYMLADIVLSTSIEPEAFGRVVAEAQAMGRMTIASALGGSCETIIDGKTGFLVPAGDMNALQRQIREVLSLPDTTQEVIRQQAMAHVRNNFSLQKMCDKTIAIYRQLLSTS